MSWWRRQAARRGDDAAGPVSPPGPRGRATEERYRAADLVAAPAGGGEALVYRRGAGASHCLSESAVDLLQRCTTFRTLDDHCQTLARDLHLDASLHAPVRNELEQLVALGLLTSHESVWQEALAAYDVTTEGAPPGIATVAVVTCDRPDAALRCVESVIEAARRHGRDPALVVSDDSRDPASAARLRDAIDRLATDYPAVTHTGRAEREGLATALAAELGDDREVRGALRFALFGSPDEITPGANRNALLLHHAGRPFLSLDDDTVCRVAAAPGSEDGLAVSSLPDPSQFWFYPDRGAALTAHEWQEVDPVALHEDYLGRTAAACVADLGGPERLDLDQADATLLRRLGTGGRVAVTATGLAGDSGMGSAAYFLTLRGASRERLLADYATFRDTRAVVRAVTRPTLSTGAFLMTPCVGLDATRLLPPFLPVGRNEDGAFAHLLRIVAPDALIAHSPWAIYHDPPESRAFSPEALHTPLTTLSPAQAITLALTASPLGPDGDPATRLERAARALQDVAALADADFVELLYLQRLAQIGRHIAHLDESLRLYDGDPAPWADDLTAAIEAARDSLHRPADLLPAALGDPAERLGAARDLLRRFGLLLAAWPTLFAAARRLNAT
ncbi:MAG: hypothetical protein PVF51_13045 [Nitrospirota bacterium]|jgi:hypothetical protein